MTTDSALAKAAAPTTEWYRLSTREACQQLSVDPAEGLSTAEVERRRAQYGSNKLAEEAKEPGWKAFLRQYQDLMQLVLLGAAVVSIIALQEVSTGLVIIGLTVLNAVMGMHQEGKAAESVASLRKMLIMTASVHRDGQIVKLPAEELVPGDIIGFEAGDKVAADGRLLVAATLEIEEAGLTGESTPASKSIEAVTGEHVALGDRSCMAFMNTQVTRGRGEMVVTTTGMGTEMGHISGMLSGVQQDKTPLTKQLDQLTVIITVLASIALVAIILIGLARDQDFDELFLIGISLAISAIPTGLPLVVTTLLSMGTQQLAGHGAIVKKLKSVETLGSTSAICSDKTGTLTLNQMTARQLVLAGRRFDVDGEGYATVGQILRVGGTSDVDFEPFMLPMALANDAVIRDGECIGDPTEGALVVLAAKSGLDVDGTRRELPRVGEVPFDSAYKLMATFHEMDGRNGEVVRCYVKGAPDQLLARSTFGRDVDGATVPIEEFRQRVLDENDRLASEGLRVMAVAQRDLDPAGFDSGSDLLTLVTELELLALVGIVDPPRKEAKDAIALCHDAGIRVRMITGDHATTAAAIATQLGIEGRAITGAEFAAMPDEQLLAELVDIGVVARVAPEDKVRLVSILKQQGNIVAMTGDGVNDAPALTRADIGVAMGITGTEVTKDAAEMILTDDNFATIVKAVEGGRGLYDNLMKYIRFQMISLGGFILTFLGASIFDIAGGAPLAPLQILWINFSIDVLLALGLGFDAPIPGLMRRMPRPLDQPVLPRPISIRLGVSAVLIAIATLSVVMWAEDRLGLAVATTMGMTVMAFLHIISAMEYRDLQRTIFDRSTIANGRFNMLVGVCIVLTLLAISLGPLQRMLGTVDLGKDEWRVILITVVAYTAVLEIFEFFARRLNPQES